MVTRPPSAGSRNAAKSAQNGDSTLSSPYKLPLPIIHPASIAAICHSTRGCQESNGSPSMGCLPYSHLYQPMPLVSACTHVLPIPIDFPSHPTQPPRVFADVTTNPHRYHTPPSPVEVPLSYTHQAYPPVRCFTAWRFHCYLSRSPPCAPPTCGEPRTSWAHSPRSEYATWCRTRAPSPAPNGWYQTRGSLPARSAAAAVTTGASRG